jgi:hypothetical protein
MPGFELDPHEAERFVRGMPLRQELVYRLAIRGLSARCCGERLFKAHTEALVEQSRKDLRAVLREASKLEEELAASVAGR